MRFTVHPHGQHCEGKQTRLSSGDGVHFLLAVVVVIFSYILEYRQAPELSRAMYATILEKLGAMYDPSKIRGAFVRLAFRSLLLTKARSICFRWQVWSHDDGFINKRCESFFLAFCTVLYDLSNSIRGLLLSHWTLGNSNIRMRLLRRHRSTAPHKFISLCCSMTVPELSGLGDLRTGRKQ